MRGTSLAPMGGIVEGIILDKYIGEKMEGS
jgi:hypothetical protein